MSLVTEYNPIVAATRTLLNVYNSPNPVVSEYKDATGRSFFGSNQPAPDPPLFDNNDQIKLVGKLREELRGSDFNLGVFLGESHQTLQMLAQTATTLASVAHALKKGNVTAAIKALAERLPTSYESRFAASKRRMASSSFKSTTANNWLELQYGWLPLLSDMKSGAELLSHRLHMPFVKRYKVRISKKLTPEEVLAYTKSKTGLMACLSGASTRRRQLIAIISEPESIPVLTGMLDPELIVWELTPFSFVADWVVPIGDYLEARAFANRLGGTFITTDLVKRYVSGLGNYYQPTAVGYERVTCGGAFEWKAVSMTRTVSNVLNVPMPSVKSFAKIAGWQHCANALALMAQAFRSKS
jgi:hypothetical protein